MFRGCCRCACCLVPRVALFAGMSEALDMPGHRDRRAQNCLFCADGSIAVQAAKAFVVPATDGIPAARAGAVALLITRCHYAANVDGGQVPLPTHTRCNASERNAGQAAHDCHHEFGTQVTKRRRRSARDIAFSRCNVCSVIALLLLLSMVHQLCERCILAH